GLALRGMGYPSRFEMKKDSVSIEIENAFNPILYAAKIASFLEHSLGWKSDIKWETRELSYSKYVISAT
ncbi:MAG: hypothetical protein PHO53_06400, partial [Actinomycetota bacterium]|nr:hypothetical protein [Actinomycetota bacterium]